jgi:cephalosporin hydroxylase
MQNIDDPLGPARDCYDHGELQAALASLAKVLDGAAYTPGAFLLKSQCNWRLGSPHEALQFARAELVMDPSFPGAAAHLAVVESAVTPPAPAVRPWATALDSNTIRHFEHCSHRYTYRSVPMNKDAFDLALYPMLLWQTKPRTIIEVGSFFGGSALWMADLMAGYGLDTHVYSVDVVKVWTARHDRVTFLNGSGQNLAGVFSEAFLADLPRPLLVIEDADHSFATTAAVLDFFHPVMRPGEYVLVEDGMTAPPALQALQQSLATHPLDYHVDSTHCDYFGQNVTWNVNGFLRRMGPVGGDSRAGGTVGAPSSAAR